MHAPTLIDPPEAPSDDLVGLSRTLVSEVGALATTEAERYEQRFARLARRGVQALAFAVAASLVGFLGILALSGAAVMLLAQVGLPRGVGLALVGGLDLAIAMVLAGLARASWRHGQRAPNEGLPP